MGPLEGCQVWEFADMPAASFAGRLLSFMGATVTMIEPPGGSPLREIPPFADGHSATFEYLSAGKRSMALPEDVDAAIEGVHILLHDSPLPPEVERALVEGPLPASGRAAVACTPYGLTGPKSAWGACELTLFQAGGEGYLIPHGLPYEEHPDRPPIGMARYLAHYQGGIASALGAVAALRHARASGRLSRVDVSIQDVEVSLNYFTVSRFFEGTREDRASRAFSYAGILRCADGYAEVVPLEQHQWEGVRSMLGDPDWAFAEGMDDPITRGRNGHVVNEHLRRWAAGRTVEEVVRLATEHGIPCGPYLAPEQLPLVEQLRHRAFFVGRADGTEVPATFPGPAWVLDRWDKPRVGAVPAPPRP